MVEAEDVKEIGPFARGAAMITAALLFARGRRARSSFDWLHLAIGAELLLIGVTGSLRFGASRDRREDHPTDNVEDIVDLASELSFPASDPPAY
jgi:hypothetical protein